MLAPVIVTLAKPSASGSAAAASDPKTASRIDEDDREADPLGALEVVLREVLHAGPERLLADEVWLDAAARRRGAQLVAEVDRHVGRLVAVALDLQRHDGDGRAGRVALGALRPRRA